MALAVIQQILNILNNELLTMLDRKRLLEEVCENCRGNNRLTKRIVASLLSEYILPIRHDEELRDYKYLNCQI